MNNEIKEYYDEIMDFVMSKNHYPEPTSERILELAIQMQRNRILSQGMVVPFDLEALETGEVKEIYFSPKKHPGALEAIAIELKGT